MDIVRVDDMPTNPDDKVTLKQTGNVFEVRTMMCDAVSLTKKVSADEYIDLRTGEVKIYKHKSDSRADNMSNVARSFKGLRDIINCNVTEPDKCLFVTLTYRENMRDTEKLYDDFRKFNMRFKAHCKRNGLGEYEYICVSEPQGRGAWHCHVIYIFDCNKPYIPNKRLAEIWGNGFVKVNAIKSGVYNIGYYLTAYLTDVALNDITDYKLLKTIDTRDIKNIETTDENGNKVTKAVVKGLRLRMYPKGMNIFRCSRGVKKPVITKCTRAEAMSVIGDAPKIYEKTISLENNNDYIINQINYQYYDKSLSPDEFDMINKKLQKGMNYNEKGNKRV